MPKKAKSAKTKGRMKQSQRDRAPSKNNTEINSLLKDAVDAKKIWAEKSKDYQEANPFILEKDATTGGILGLARITKVQSNNCFTVYVNGQEIQAVFSDKSVEHLVSEKCKYWLPGSRKGPLVALFIPKSNTAQILCTFDEEDIRDFVLVGFKRPVDLFDVGGKGGAADDIEFESESEDGEINVDAI
jgi:hypothetical protein